MTSSEVTTCINCGAILVNLLYPVLEQCPAAITLFSEWLSPYNLKENDHICRHCLDYAQYKIRKLIKTGHIKDETQPLSSSVISQIENRKVCLVCAKSILRERYTKPVLWPNGPEKNQEVSKLIFEALLVPHKKIDGDSRVCFLCWRKMVRKLEKRQSDSTETYLESKNNDPQNDLQDEWVDLPNHRSPDNSLQDECIDLPNNRSPGNSLQDECINLPNNRRSPDNSLQDECIDLPNYRRSPDNSSCCLFENCPNQDLRTISDDLRATIIKRHRYLVTAQARVCRQHTLKYNWNKLFDAKNSMSTFKPEHVEHVLSVSTKNCANVDFNNYLNLDNNIIEYCLGLSKESLTVIMKTLPELQGVENGVFGLMGLLMKHWNGGSISKVAGLLKICPKSLETAMIHVLEILKHSPVTINMGIEYLIRK